jgi:GTP-binding protein
VRRAGKRGGGAAGRAVAETNQSGTEGGGAQSAPFVRRETSTANPLHSEPVEFVGSFPDPRVNLEPALPEIAFIGRSNVGKSSLLNALVGRTGLARVSGSPGKTTLLNFYRLPQLYLVDLPGYGFARASKGQRAGYHRLITGYLQGRDTLAGIVWLLDIRHQPSKEDREMQELLRESGRPVLAVLTKADKLTRSALGLRQRELARTLELDPEQIALTSSRSGLGVAELAASVLAAAGEPAP